MILTREAAERIEEALGSGAAAAVAGSMSAWVVEIRAALAELREAMKGGSDAAK